jgi:predicted amidohydrolase YtcJ
MTKTVFRNAGILTMDAAHPRATSIAIENGRILAVDEAVPASDAKLVDCRGGTLLPAFIDAHLHLLSYAASLVSVDCSPDAVSSIVDIQNALRRRVAQLPAGALIRAVGHDEFSLAERRHPAREELDAAALANPVRLIHRSGHASVLNSRALALVGIGPDAETSGLLIDMDKLLDAAIPPIDDIELKLAVAQANDNLLAAGVTAIQDATATNGPKEWERFRRLMEEGDLRLSVTLFEGYDGFGQLPEEALEGRLRRGPVKIVINETSDGTVPDERELTKTVRRVHESGRQVAIHAVEQRAVEAAVNAIEAALRRKPKPDHRHRIEHCSVCPPALAERIAKLGIAVASQPAFLCHSADRYRQQVPRDELPHLYPFGDFLRSGLRLAAGSDAPVIPPRPLLSVQSAVTRRGRLGASLSPEQAVTIEQALRMHTLDAAWSAFQESGRGSIEVGKRADFVLLSGDPTAVPADEITDLEVEMTVIGGDVVSPPSR